MDLSPRVDERRGDQSGLALILGLFFTLVISGICVTGSLLLKSHITKNRVSFASKNQALQVARSGLTEAVNWMRRQTSQPVLAFNPQLDTVASPPVLETIEPDVGLVREFKITGATWARYEVWKRWDSDPDAERLAWRQQFQCEDISEGRSDASPGTVWRIRSVGYIYNRVDPNVAYNVQPNSVIASQVAVDEIRRLVISLPANAAIITENGDTCQINSNGRVLAAPYGGIFYSTGNIANSPRIVLNPLRDPSIYFDSYDGVFGMGFTSLQALANQVVTTPAEFPSPVPSMALVVSDCGPLTIDSSNPLLGTGIVVVRGNLTIAAGSNSNFSGLLYVDGNLVIRSPSEINGAIVCTGSVLVQGATDYATINFDEDVLTTLMQQIGTYRLSNTTTLPRISR